MQNEKCDALYLADSSSGNWNQTSQKQALDVYFDCPFYYCTTIFILQQRFSL